MSIRLTLMIVWTLCNYCGARLFAGEDWTTGYIAVEQDGDSLFYYLFRCRNHSNLETPLYIYLQGGPGSSTALSVMIENGPYHFDYDTLEYKKNPYSFNNLTDVLYVDQPLGTAFSVIKNPKHYCDNMTCVAKHFYTFLVKFLDLHQEYKQRDIYIGGVSYAGHYVPAIAVALHRSHNPNIRLKGISLGNALIDSRIQLQSYPYYLYEENKIAFSTYLEEKTKALLCEFRNDTFFLIHCVVELIANLPIKAGLVNWYDISAKEHFGRYFGIVASLLNSSAAQEELAVVPQPWNFINDDVARHLTYDWTESYKKDIEYLLDSGLKVLLYYGDRDYVCNWRGAETLINAFEWMGAREFQKIPYKPYVHMGKEYGQYREYKQLSFVRVYNGSHFTFIYNWLRPLGLDLLHKLID